MTSLEVTNDLHNELQAAYKSARSVYNQFRNVPPHKISIEERFIKDMSMVVVEAIDAVESNTRMSPTWYDKLSLYVGPDNRIKILQLGYSLSVLIAKLMTDRIGMVPEAAPSDSQPSTSHSSEHIGEGPLFEMSDEVKEEVKEEPIEIKEEPEEYLEIKQEPLEDVFCPTTGDSRPADQIASTSQTPPLSYLNQQIKLANHTVNGDEEFMQDLAALPQLPVRKVIATGAPRPASMLLSSSQLQPTTEQLKPQKCYLCNRYTTDYASTQTYLNCRKAFLDKVIVSNESQRIKMGALRASRVHAAFCQMHIAPSVPLKAPFMKAPFGVLPIERQPVAQRPEENVVFTPAQICDLCDEPELPCRLSPKDRTEAQRFFAIVDARTSDQADYIQHCIINYEQATICMKHFPKKELKEEKIRPKKTPKYDVVKSTLDLVHERMILRTAGKTVEVFPGSTPRKQPLYRHVTPAMIKRQRDALENADRSTKIWKSSKPDSDH